jgi:hypothetical protein
MHYKERLILLAAAMAQQTSSNLDRQKFLALMDYIQSTKPLPEFRADGRSRQPNRTAIIYSWMLWIIAQVRGGVLPEAASTVNKALALAEKAAACYLPGVDFEIVGSVAAGWTLEVKSCG